MEGLHTAGVGTGLPWAVQVSEDSLGQGLSSRKGPERALRKKGRRGIIGDYSPICKLLLFSTETGESTVIFFNENRQQNSL